jgi:hypothetical protein
MTPYAKFRWEQLRPFIKNILRAVLLLIFLYYIMVR